MLKQVIAPDGVTVWATAPNESWKLVSEEKPEIGTQVEACWSNRFAEPAGYQYALLSWKPTRDGSPWWYNKYNHQLLFAPDFWKPTVSTQ